MPPGTRAPEDAEEKKAEERGDASFSEGKDQVAVAHEGEKTLDQGSGDSYNSTTKQPNNLTTADASVRRIGFFGLLSEWVDQDLLVALAEIKDCEIILAGKADVDTSRLSAIENIKMIGAVPYKELPALVATFDLGIIPFKVNELTRAVNPIKLREMLAAGCPVVSTNLPEVKKLASEMPEGAVSVAGSREEFVGMVRTVIERASVRRSCRAMEDKGSTDGGRVGVQRKLISDAVKDQDWSAKVDEILSLLGT